MKSLNEEALRRAREKICEQFSDATVLEDIATVRMAIEAKLSASESLLNGAVQNKLDALNSVVDLMNLSTSKVRLISLLIL